MPQQQRKAVVGRRASAHGHGAAVQKDSVEAGQLGELGRGIVDRGERAQLDDDGADRGIRYPDADRLLREAELRCGAGGQHYVGARRRELLRGEVADAGSRARDNDGAVRLSGWVGGIPEHAVLVLCSGMVCLLDLASNMRHQGPTICDMR